jgi:hypothetical protein
MTIAQNLLVVLAFRSGKCLVTQLTSPAVDETATVVKMVSVKLRTSPTFSQEGGNETCALLVYYAAYGGNFLPTFRNRYHIRCVVSQKSADLICIAGEITQGCNEITQGWNEITQGWNKVTLQFS